MLLATLWSIPHDLGTFDADGRRLGKYDGGPVSVVEYEEDGRTIREEVDSNGVRHGQHTAWENGKKVIEGRFENDLQEGRWTYWGPGAVQMECGYSAGSLDGPSRSTYESGQLAEVGQYRAGLEQGAWKFWHEDGTLDLDRTGYYEAGERVRALEADEAAPR